MVSTIGGTGVGADYGCAAPLAPGAVDPVRLAGLVEGVEAGGLAWDPVEEALFGPDPEVDAAALFATLDAAAPEEDSGAASGVAADPAADVIEPAVLVPARLPGVEDMPPGPGLAGLLDAATLPQLGAYELVEAIAGWQRIASWAAARQPAAISELSRRAEMRPTTDGRPVESMSPARVTGLAVAARLVSTPREGEALTARALCPGRGQLPGSGRTTDHPPPADDIPPF